MIAFRKIYLDGTETTQEINSTKTTVWVDKNEMPTLKKVELRGGVDTNFEIDASTCLDVLNKEIQELCVRSLPQAICQSDNIFDDNHGLDWAVTDCWSDKRVNGWNLYIPVGRRNPVAAAHSNTQDILRLKKKDESAITRFFVILDKLLCSGITVAVVPGHDSENKCSGMQLLGKQLAACKNRLDASGLLDRHKTVAALHGGGSREPSVHEQSIRLLNNVGIYDKRVVLLDDVSVTENSLNVCRDLLLAYGAKRVKMLALGNCVPDRHWGTAQTTPPVPC